MMKITLSTICMVVVLLAASASFAASVEKASMPNKHGLTQEAKLELIDVIFSDSDDSAKAQAYYLLGSIAFAENKASVALDSWLELVKKYPSSSQSSSVEEKIRELSGQGSQLAKETIEDAVALSYLKHGEFWSEVKDSKFVIDNNFVSEC